ncbi:MAG TPA: LamG-like jellyroll fold domain-containing protein, partial [Anaerolineae bacterium]|nr:LamG-like jellyroll fold domain-containing protein [Anaerolineae bacterium]
LAIMLASAAKNGDTVKVIADVLLATGLILTGFGVITAMGRVVRAVAEKGSLAKVLQAALGLSTNLKNSWELSKCLTTVVAIAMNFLVFMMQWGSGMAVGSLGWDGALAGAIAGSLAAMLMWVIFNAFGPIGTLVQAIIALVDMVVGFICTLTDAYEKQPVVAKWFCGGVTGLITNLYKSAIYSGNVMVDMKAKDRVQFSGWNYAVVHQERGIVAGNAINIKVNVTSTVTMAKFPYDSLWADIWNNQWKDANVKKSNFKYVWKDYDWATVDPQYGAATTLWQPTTTAHQFELLQPANSTQGFPLGNPGIRSLKAYLIEGYAVPEQECWGVWPAGGCWVHENTDSNAYEIGSSMVFAVLPATLDGFRTLAAKGQGYAQSWGNISFPVLYDADNDGLPYSSDGDDHVADRDGDGLLDGYEIEIGSNPAAADSDGDGLNDHFEILAGADPNLADTDGDGLTDGEEVGRQDLQDTDRDGNTAEWLGGWQFVYAYDKTTGAPRKAWVWSDPLSVDADGDTLTDAQERVYGYHPGVKSSLNILTIDSQFNEWDKASGGYIPSDGMVQPTQNLYYVATVTNQLLSREAEGLLSTEVASGIGEGDMPDRPFVLRPQEQSSTSGSVNFSRAPESGVYSVDQEAGATISDWSTTAGGMILWLPFNDPNAPGFDRSGNLPPHDGTCYSGRGVASWAGCALDPNGIYGNGLRLDGESFLESTVELPQFGGAVALWFKTTSTGSRDLVNTPLLTGSNPFWIYIDGGVLHSVMGAAVAPSSAIAAGPGTLPGYADGKWHHVVVTYGRATPAGSAELHKLYVDGQLKGAGTASQLVAPASSGIDLGGQKNLDTTYSRWLPGMIDDVRVYDHRLSQREVADLYGHVAFSMDFNPANPWQDTSGQGATVGCLTGYCPSVSSSGAGFDGAQYLTASGAIPNLSSGRLTLSAWIYPQNRGDAKDGWYQGILGYHSTLGDTTAYPTLERFGLKVR